VRGSDLRRPLQRARSAQTTNHHIHISVAVQSQSRALPDYHNHKAKIDKRRRGVGATGGGAEAALGRRSRVSLARHRLSA
jgi:hypothetical protein